VSLKTPPSPTQEIEIPAPLTVGELAAQLGISPADVQRDLMKIGILANLNAQVTVANATKVAQARGFHVKSKDGKSPAAAPASALGPTGKKTRPAGPVPRPPVVVIMGHVDHGKTTLLDSIRRSNVTEQEFGGITQHIGAYQVDVETEEKKDDKPVTKKITFLDTPGHEAFTAMRARGARGADIAVLVVAADDGVMPQTVEAINHAKAAGVRIIIAINKVDLPGANVQRVMQQLTDNGLVPRAWGGDYDAVEVAAKEGLGVDDLLEHVLFEAEAAELKADPNAVPADGTIIEARLDPGKGPVATVLVDNGTLLEGDAVIAGTAFGKIRAMMNDRGQRVQKAGPATPVELLGLSTAPMAGDRLQVVENERDARRIVSDRRDQSREQRFGGRGGGRITLEDLFRQIQQGEIRDLNLVVKGDVQGSVEAVRQSLERLQNEEVRVQVIAASVGNVGESDILLASASSAIVIGFNVKVDPQAKRAAADEGVDIRTYKIIYDLIEDVEKALTGMLTPVFKEVVLGKAEVRMLIRVPRSGVVAGSYVTDGKIVRGAEARLFRDKKVIYTGKIDSLKHFKEDVREMAAGFECGILLDNFNDFKEGDIIEAFQMEQINKR
jgi:translation initiation factor IF-2